MSGLPHNSTFGHIDHDHRTYRIDEQVWPYSVIHAYKDSYRLKENMLIPRSGDALIDDSFPLCMNTCHDAHPYVFSDIKYCLTSFRDSPTSQYNQYHSKHLDNSLAWYDSDWDWDTDPPPDEDPDSATSCPACHNVHGSPMDLDPDPGIDEYYPNPVMIRHGELISAPGTEDKVPGIGHYWLNVIDPTNVLSQSDRGTGDVWSTVNLCNAGVCHIVGRKYERTPGGDEEIVDMAVWTADDNCEPEDSFSPGEPVHYHLSFYLTGPIADEPQGWCVKTKVDFSAAYHLPYETGWITPVVMEGTILPRGQHTECWAMTIPSDAEIDDARFYMELLMGTPDCLDLLNSNIQTHDFTVVE
jgi:hypothetical protein